MEAYLLILARRGMNKELASKLMKMHYVKKIDVTEGEYDLIAEIQAKNEGKLFNIVQENIRRLGGVEFISPLIVRH